MSSTTATPGYANGASTNTCNDLWSRLVNKELSRVRQSRHLSSLFLSSTLLTDEDSKSPSKIDETLIEQAQSTRRSAVYYKRVIDYMASQQSSDGIRRIAKFVDELDSELMDLKTETRAKQFRQTGNQLYKSKHLAAAAEAYRRGLSHMPSAFESMDQHLAMRDDFSCLEAALLHGNLSAVLYAQGHWVACLWHTLLALEKHLCISGPSRANTVIERIWSRVHQCCDQLCWSNDLKFDWSVSPNREKVMSVFERLTRHSISLEETGDKYPMPRYGRQTKYPALSNGLKVNSSQTKGRHVIAKAPFKPGDVLAIEPASGWSPQDLMQPHGDVNNCTGVESLLLLPTARALRCTACLNPLQGMGFSCPDCCEAAYCGPPSQCFVEHTGLRKMNLKSAGCGEVASKFGQPEWHKMECRFLFLLNSIGVGHLCLRLLKYGRNHSKPSVADLVDHFAEFDPAELFEYALTAWLVAHILVVERKTTADRDGEFVAGLWCFDTLRRLQLNAHAMTEVLEFTPFQDADTNASTSSSYALVPRLDQQRLAVGLFPCVSMLNHSCEPSVENGFDNQFLVLRCVRPIAAGDEVFNCYGPHHLHEFSATERRDALEKQYFFKCDCTHCVKASTSDLETNLSPSVEQSDAWERSVARLKQFTNAETPPCFTNVYQSWADVCSLGTIQSMPTTKSLSNWWPTMDTPGSLMDNMGNLFIQSALQSNNSDSSVKLAWIQLGCSCLLTSVCCVQGHYGPGSSEYLWELVNVMRVVLHHFSQWPAVELPPFKPPSIAFSRLAIPTSLDGAFEHVFRLTHSLYGERKASRVLLEFFPKRFHHIFLVEQPAKDFLTMIRESCDSCRDTYSQMSHSCESESCGGGFVSMSIHTSDIL